MTDTTYILAIDQGTTSSRAIVFDQNSKIVAVSQLEFPQHYPDDGWVEHDPDDIWQTTLTVTRAALEKAESLGGSVAGIGITNQRETTIVWDKRSGTPIYNAIVWQDRRTAAVCEGLIKDGLQDIVNQKTGLRLDPYFSATKVSWILDNVEGARDLAVAGHLAFGTVDSFLIWKLTGGQVHATDVTNASRTNLFNIHSLDWDPELLEIFKVPASVLPDLNECADDYGMSEASILGRAIPIRGVAGDQHAAAIGQCCFSAGSIKSTYGTGCFMLLNTGDQAVLSKNRLLTTIAYQIDGQISYALEGSIFIAGAAVQWLRDGIKIIDNAADTEALVTSQTTHPGLYLVPAFTGLGAPHWNPNVRGALFGITQATNRADLVRATLESVCFQTNDLLTAMHKDGGNPSMLRVDGGMVANNWLLQFLSDVLQIPIDRPQVMETTALGAAYLAGKSLGVYGDFDEFSKQWAVDQHFEPQMTVDNRNTLIAGWDEAIRRLTA
ncbi:MAG: glycerol kinase GlpK [Gammaproteobacteria bacterium]|nr:glycerol kinase GlpK [Gammaproteobacteria bacterium]